MKRAIFVMVAMTMALTGCRNEQQEFRAEDGAVNATCMVDSRTGERSHWKITTADGHELVEGYDSMRVVEVGEKGHPQTVCYHRGADQVWIQFYSTMAKRSEGTVRDGHREGEWLFYYPTGQVQTKCTFVNGVEEGEYVVFRESGIPYYRGQYIHGQRVGDWEVYDPNGNLVERKSY